MGKRSDFERRDRDAYDTPREAVLPLLAHLKPCTRFIEPCAGNMVLAECLFHSGHDLVLAYDIEPPPGRDDVQREDALTFRPYIPADCFITNPPWRRDILHPLITHLSDQLPTWLLFDADWVHTRQATPYLGRLRRIVSVGRVKWIPDSKMTGKDNCAWHLFDSHPHGICQFFGRP